VIIVGRLAWTEGKRKRWTPWVSFESTQEFKDWCRDMRAEQEKPGRRLTAEHITVDRIWTADTLLREVRRHT
jgi:hypothetical protein